MQLSENDVILLKQLLALAERNRGSKNKVALQISKGHLSPEMRQLLEIQDNNSSGVWAFGVYLEFVPMFKETQAKDWQK